MTAIPVQSVREQMIALLTARFGLEENLVSPEMTFSSMELDSLALVEFSIALQEDFGVPVSEDEFTAENTVDEVAELMAGKLTAQDPVG
ncbi:acyl carrier protein [Streptomyces salinarius]|uniref:acyl carrier protein n=1 Tax=Streptomyces salinarius TaxID=2762598 RepID=UPI0013DBA41E|nr:acyl carrier protein [Streptomyces salinarius]